MAAAPAKLRMAARSETASSRPSRPERQTNLLRCSRRASVSVCKVMPMSEAMVRPFSPML